MKSNLKILFKRLGAYVVDWYLYAVVLISFNTIYSTMNGIEPTYYMTLEIYDKQNVYVVMTLMFMIHFLIFVVLCKLLKGQTIGKKLFHLRIVSKDDQPVRSVQLLLREFLGIILIEGYFSPISSYFRTFLAIQFGDIIELQWMWYMMALVSIVIARFIKNNRMIHDLVANTKVIHTTR